MIKSKLIKTISLTIVAMSVTLSNTIYANAEDNINVEQAKSEIVRGINPTLENGLSLTADDLEFEEETTVKKHFDHEDTKINLIDEKIYNFKNKQYLTNHYYYGLNSKCIYNEYRGTGGGSLTVLKDGNIYAEFEFCGGNYSGPHGWFGTNGWSQDANYPYWYYFKNGIVQTGWIYDNGKWYYCNSNGEMAHDTTIEGYTLSSSGAWIQ